MTSIKKTEKKKKIKTVDVTFFLTTGWVFFNKIKGIMTDIFSIICVIFYIPNSLNYNCMS